MTALWVVLIVLASLTAYVMIGGYFAGLANAYIKDDFDRDAVPPLMRLFWPIMATGWGFLILSRWAAKKPYELGRSHPERKSVRANAKDPSVPLIGELIE